MLIGAPDLRFWRARAAVGDGGVGFAISTENFRRAADMCCTIDRLRGPAALACFGGDERNTVDLKERFGLFEEFRAAGFRLRKRLH